MGSSEEGDSPVTVRDESPLSVDQKREMVRELDGMIKYGGPGLESSTWTTFPGCVASFVRAEHDHLEVTLHYDTSELPGPVVITGPVDDDSSLVSQGEIPTGFVQLSAAHEALYEDLTDAAGRAVDPYAVTVPDTPFAQEAVDGVVTFVASLGVLTGESSSDPQTFEWG
ncbi:hypothetical protein [Halobaculum limi]|uniref:hypothetical protein n=1 Tax=Halobaculum limi TaxID=3031916 RepID=UPI0024061D56|nr:hypothetical protein [Halobaculum sp. YSMS11]